MAPHSNTLAWKIPWMEEPGRLQSMGSLRVGHDWATTLSLITIMHWRRKWQSTPVFWPGESQGWGEPGGLPSMGSHRVRQTEATYQLQEHISHLLWFLKIKYLLIDYKPVQCMFSVLGFWGHAFDHHLTFPFVKWKNIFVSLSVGNKIIKYL